MGRSCSDAFLRKGVFCIQRTTEERGPSAMNSTREGSRDGTRTSSEVLVQSVTASRLSTMGGPQLHAGRPVYQVWSGLGSGEFSQERQSRV